jgi:outer membrane protein assembly factor BamB
MRVLLLILIGTATAVGASGAPAAALSDPPILDDLVTDGPVEAMHRLGDRLYVGGRFGYVGRRTGSGVALSTATGRPNPLWPRLSGDLSAALPDGIGGFFVAGALNPRSLDGPMVAHVTASGRLDPDFHPAVRGRASALALRGNRLFVGGMFPAEGGTPSFGVVALDSATGARDPGFLVWMQVKASAYSHPPSGFSPPAAPCAAGGTSFREPPLPGAAALSLGGGRLYIGGDFDMVNGVERRNLVAVDPASGRVEETFAPLLSGPRPFASWMDRVTAIAPSGGRLLIARASFGVDETSLLALDATTGARDPLFVANTHGTITSLAVSVDRVYAGRQGAPDGGVAAYDLASGELVREFRVRALVSASALVLKSGRLYAASDEFVPQRGDIGVGPRPSIVALDPRTGARAGRFAVRADGPVVALAAGRGSLFAGGRFVSIAGLDRSGLAAFDLASGKLSPSFVPVGMRQVTALAAAHGRLIASGDFSGPGPRRETLIALDPRSGHRIRRFRAPADAGGGWTLARLGSRLYVGSERGGPLRAYDAGTGRRLPTFRAAAGNILSTTASRLGLYVLAAAERSGTSVLRLDPRTGARLPEFKPFQVDNRPSNTRAIGLAGGRLYVSDSGSAIARYQLPYSVRALDPRTGALDFRFVGPPMLVHRFSPSGGRLLLGGTQIGSGLVSLNMRTGTPTRRFAAQVGGTVCALYTTRDRVYAGGNFARVGDRNQPFFAAFAPGSGRPISPAG